MNSASYSSPVLSYFRDRQFFASPVSKFYITSNQYLVERFTLTHELEGHDGCVNTVLFSECGELVITGSDDTHVNIYRLQSGEKLRTLPTSHTNNIFWAKDLPSSNCEKLISCAGTE